MNIFKSLFPTSKRNKDEPINVIPQPMAIRIKNSIDLEFKTPSDLEELIPDGMPGKVLNFGQGEGQLQIGGTVFGFYLDEHGNYSFQFEEGSLEWSELSELISKLSESISKRLSSPARLMIDGPYSNRDDI